jgi:hypothetical protein
VKRLCLVCLLGLWLLSGCADPTPTPCDPSVDTQRCSGSEIRQECSAESATWVNVEVCPADTSCGGNGRSCQQALSEGECRSKSDCDVPGDSCYHPNDLGYNESCGQEPVSDCKDISYVVCECWNDSECGDGEYCSYEGVAFSDSNHLLCGGPGSDVTCVEFCTPDQPADAWRFCSANGKMRLHSRVSCSLDTDCSDHGGFCVVGRCASEPGACTWFY